MADVNPVAPETAGPDSSTIPPVPPTASPVTLADALNARARAAAAEEAGTDGVGDYLGAWSEDPVAFGPEAAPGCSSDRTISRIRAARRDARGEETNHV